MTESRISVVSASTLDIWWLGVLGVERDPGGAPRQVLRSAPKGVWWEAV